MKLTNVSIHLVNGILLWRVLAELLGLWNSRRPQRLSNSTVDRLGIWISLAWLFNPINLSPVLYVVQRMESLAQLFVLGGLLLYLIGRRRMLQGQGGLALALTGLLAGAGLGALSKESAVLLPLYAFLVEVCLLRFEPAPTRRHLQSAYVVILLLPAILGFVWLLPRTLAEGAYAGRSFSLLQRLQTECRVLIDYASWTLFPRPDAIGFYHDDIEVSQGWLAPPSTLACAILIAVLLALAAMMNRRRPLFCLGIGWYFAAHLLTATIIPLELVFEHRNYFASIGLLLAAAALFLELPEHYRLLRKTLPLLALGAFMLTTAQRAFEWGNPIRLAYAEAGEHSQSARANYELGRTLIVASGYRPDSKLIDPATRALQTAAALPGASLLPQAALIVVAGHLHRPADPRLWQTLTAKLAARTPSEDDVSALVSLYICQRQQECPAETSALLSAFLAALGHGAPSARLLGAYGGFAANELGDYPLAIRSLRDAISLSPQTPGYRFDLVAVLLLQGDAASAAAELAKVPPDGLGKAERVRIQELSEQVKARSLLPVPNRQAFLASPHRQSLG
jgi:tetratricopeptide (TPR) repeat protein